MTEQESPGAGTPEADTMSAVARMMDVQMGVAQVNQKAMMMAIIHKKGDGFFADLDRLRVKPDFNPRLPSPRLDAHIRSLAASMEEEGFLENHPISVVSGYEGKKIVLFIVDGHCRFEALKLAIANGAKIEWVPVVVRDRATTDEDLDVSVVRDNSGLELTPLEKAIIVKRLLRYHWSVTEIAKKLGFTETYVNNLIRIAGAPSEIRRLIQDNKISASVALQAMQSHGPEATQVLSKAVTHAMATGKIKVTRRSLPDQVLRRALTKQAPDLLRIVTRVREHAAYGQLPDDLRTDIQDLLTKIAAAENKVVEQVAQPASDDLSPPPQGQVLE